MELSEKKIESKSIFSGKIIRLFHDTVLLPNGKEAFREIIRHGGAVCIVALDENDNVVIEKQYRYPYNKIITEIPAGKKEKDEDALLCAKRELSEETGISASRWEYLGEYYPSVAISDEVIHMYAARNLTYKETHPDEDEFIQIDKINIKELVDMIMRGEIADGKTQTAVLKVWNKYYR